MGNSLRCLGLWRGSSDGARDDVPAASAAPLLKLENVLENLPPNHLRSRLQPALPSIAISPQSFQELQGVLPEHHRSRKWLQIFSTEENGFSTQSLIAACREHSRRQDSGVLLVRTAGNRVLGVFLSTWIDWQQKKYYGTRGTIVFTVDGESNKITKYVASDKNEYFMRSNLHGELTFGGGGQGPALRVFNDLSEVQSSVECPTFSDYACLLPRGCEDVVFEGGAAQAPVLGLELWGFSTNAFA